MNIAKNDQIWRHVVARVNLLAEWRIEESKHQPLEDKMEVIVIKVMLQRLDAR